MLTAHFDIHGSPECDYHVKLKVANTSMNVILDTGSANTAVISDQCTHPTCINTVQRPYLTVDPAALENPVNASYGNGKTHSSWQGYATGQLVTIADNHTVYARVDVIARHHRFFVDRCPHNQGVWGLAYPALQTRPRFRYFNHDRHHTPALQTVLDMAHAKLDLPDVFTYELCAPAQIDSRTAQGLAMITRNASSLSLPAACGGNRVGHFWLGGYPSNAIPPSSEIVWVPLTSRLYYEVSIDRFMVNGVPVPMDDSLNHPRSIVDTGSKDILLSQQNLDGLLEALWQTKMIVFDRTFISHEDEKAFWLHRAQLSLPAEAVQFDPTQAVLEVQLSGQAVDIATDNLVRVVPINSPPGWVNISLTGLSHGGGNRMAGTILGNALLLGKTTIWDRGGGRLGFALSNPDTCCTPSFAQDVDMIISPTALSSRRNMGYHHTLIMQSFFIALMITSALCATLHLAWILLAKQRRQRSLASS
ncbi:aspartic peptidase domain-containing protein [Dichotomocladium elegans]|nr:aspartic peptidase domain-containing protein [Dichotomocladium elegans]